MVNRKSIRDPFRTSLIYSDLQFLRLLQTKLESLLLKMEQEDIQREIVDYIDLIKTNLEERRKEMSNVRLRGFECFRDYFDQGLLDLIGGRGIERQEILEQLRERLTFERQQVLEPLLEEQANREDNFELMHQIARFRNICAYCGREVPPRQDVCDGVDIEGTMTMILFHIPLFQTTRWWWRFHESCCCSSK